MDILTIANLKKKFGDKEVLKGVSLSVPEKSVFGFIGKNGAGKTTTMKAVLGLMEVDDGEIYVAGEKVAYGQTKTNSYIGYLPDVPEFYNFMTAYEYLEFCGEMAGMKKEEIKLRCAEMLKLVGLSDEKHRIKGKGINNEATRKKGDMYIVLKIVTPKKLTKEQKKLLEELNKTNLEDDNDIKKFSRFVKENK